MSATLNLNETNMTDKNQNPTNPQNLPWHSLASSTGSIPSVQMVENPQGDYGMIGWDDLNEWGIRNHPMWNMAMKHAEYKGLDELTTLRLLTDCLVRQNVKLVEEFVAQAQRQVGPVTVKSNSEH